MDNLINEFDEIIRWPKKTSKKIWLLNGWQQNLILIKIIQKKKLIKL